MSEYIPQGITQEQIDFVRNCPKKLTPDNPLRQKRDATIVAMRAAGMPCRAVEQVSGVSYSEVSRISSQPHWKDLIEEYRQRVCTQLLPKVEVKLGEIVEQDDDRQLQLNAIKEVHKVATLTQPQVAQGGSGAVVIRINSNMGDVELALGYGQGYDHE